MATQTAHGHGARIVRRRNRITIRPTVFARLAAGRQTIRFHVDDVRLVVLAPPRWLRLTGALTFDLGADLPADSDDPLTVTFGKVRYREFVALLAACRWPVVRL
jgi:hypothetical protein